LLVKDSNVSLERMVILSIIDFTSFHLWRYCDEINRHLLQLPAD